VKVALVKYGYIIRNSLIASFGLLFLTGCSVFGIRTTEEPKYIVIKQQGDIQLREYSDYVVAETTVVGDFSEAGDVSFRRLFGYISGKNQGNRKIDMTAPVLARSDNNESGEKLEMTAPVVASPVNNGWTFAFVLPAGYTLDNAPIPTSPEISIKVVDSRRVAALEYTGSWDERLFSNQSKNLYAWISENKLKAVSEPRVAGYDPPWTLPFLRRNEVLIDVGP
jgi:hypothetical protein